MPEFSTPLQVLFIGFGHRGVFLNKVCATSLELSQLPAGPPSGTDCGPQLIYELFVLQLPYLFRFDAEPTLFVLSLAHQSLILSCSFP